MARGTTLLLSMVIVAPSCKSAPPPLGEALVVVDTDALVPGLVGRLRVDLYADGGAWYASRDIARPSPTDWPVSFSLFAPDGSGPRDVVVRLRAYPEGKTRDYRGEQFAPRPASTPAEEPAPPPDTTDVRLLGPGGEDATPRSEPQPLLTIDRLVRLRLVPGIRGSARLVLQGSCFGTMSDLAGGTTCVDRENVRVPVVATPLGPDMSIPPPSTLAGTFGAERPCTRSPRPPSGRLDEEVCVPGGAFIFGNPDRFAIGRADAVPERVAVVGPMLVERYEVTVERWRAALQQGLSVPQDDVVRPSVGNRCTFTTTPADLERHAISCVPWRTARAFCNFIGADLPTEAEWEYVAQSYGRPSKTTFPWGNEEPTCDRAVFGRRSPGPGESPDCPALARGPQPVDAAAHAGGDVSLGAGVVGLGGGVAEWTRDGYLSLGSRCWVGATLIAPTCEVGPASSHTTRGGAWLLLETAVRSSARISFLEDGSDVALQQGDTVGLRCVRSGVDR